ncbi:hypothetical protein GOODEAATRI_003961, partial [Goodea atripinnis]
FEKRCLTLGACGAKNSPCKCTQSQLSTAKMKEECECTVKADRANQSSIWLLQFCLCSPSPPAHRHALTLRWPWAVCQRLVASPWLAAKVFARGACLLLMVFDILAGALSFWLLRCCGCCGILKGSLVWGAVNARSFLFPTHLCHISPRPSLHLSPQLF